MCLLGFKPHPPIPHSKKQKYNMRKLVVPKTSEKQTQISIAVASQVKIKGNSDSPLNLLLESLLLQRSSWTPPLQPLSGILALFAESRSPRRLIAHIPLEINRTPDG